AQIVALERGDERFTETDSRIHCGDMLDAGAARDRGDVGDPRSRVRIESACREQAAVVEYYMNEVLRPVACERCERAEVHEHRTVAIEYDNTFGGQVHRESETDGRRESHGMLQIEK